MINFKYHMPTEVFLNKNIIKEKMNLLKNLGTKALIVTGLKSSKENGSLDDVITALSALEIDFTLYDKVEENPSVETIEEIREFANSFGPDFIIGIGGGSAIDASKAAAILLKNPSISGYDMFSMPDLSHIPVIAIPTTCGTGTEVTQYSVLTDRSNNMKRNFNQSVFPKYAFLDAKYLYDAPNHVLVNTAIDTLCHLVEGYLCANANILSDMVAERGLLLFSDCIDALIDNQFTPDVLEKLLLASNLGGMVISQTGTTLPHGMGYVLTTEHNVPHGKATGILLKSYLDLSSKNPKTRTILEILDFSHIDDFGQFLKQLLSNDCCISESQIKKYTERFMENTRKLETHYSTVDKKDIYQMYLSSLT